MNNSRPHSATRRRMLAGLAPAVALGVMVSLPAQDAAPAHPTTPPAPAPVGKDAAGAPAGKDAAAKDAAPAPTTATIERGTLRQTYPVVGEFSAHLTTNLGAQVGGRVLTVAVDVGDPVKANQVVVQLDPVFFDLEVAQQIAARTAATQHVTTEQKMAATAKLDIALAQTNLADANLQLDRMKHLFDKPAGQEPSVPRKMLDDAQTRTKQMELAVTAAQSRADEAAARVEEATAALAPIDAALATAKQRRAEAEVRAPFGAVVTRRLVSPGDTVTSAPATTLLELQDLAHLDLDFDVPQQFQATIRAGSVVDYTVAGLAGHFSGPIERILPLGTAASRTYRCRVRVDNATGQFRPGLLVQVRLTQSERSNVLIAPVGALQVSSSGWQVLVQKNGAFAAQPVEIGLRTDDQVEIVGGLALGDIVQVAPTP